MTTIISANYFNRMSSNRWMYRPESAEPSPETCKCSSYLSAKDVTFTRSSPFEQGLGCKVIGRTDSPIVTEESSVPANARELTFGPYDMRDTKTDDPVTKVSQLFLTPSGMFYLP